MRNGQVAHHQQWLLHSGVDRTRAQAHEHFIHSCVLEFAACFDALRLENLISMELIGRRLQLIERAFLDSPTAPDFSYAQEYLSLVPHQEGSVRAPNLEAFVAEELRRQALINKEVRKASENGILQRAGARVRARFGGRGRGRVGSQGGQGGTGAGAGVAAGAKPGG